MLLSREQIEEAFDRLNEALAVKGERADLYLVGGAVLCLVHRARPSTKDVDGWFSNAQIVPEAAKQVAGDLDLPEDWLTDAAKAFIPDNAKVDGWRSLGNLTISVADPRTLLAMKCAAARGAEDAGDIRFLAQKLGLRMADAVLSVVLEFYPADRLPLRTRLLIEELFS